MLAYIYLMQLSLTISFSKGPSLLADLIKERVETVDMGVVLVADRDVRALGLLPCFEGPDYVFKLGFDAFPV